MIGQRRLAALLIITFAFGCGRRAEDSAVVVNDSQESVSVTASLRSKPFATAADSETAKLFTRLNADHTNLDFTITWDRPPSYDRVFYSQNTGGGVCIGDVDSDGLPDVFLTRPSGGNRLYRNLGELRFQDVTDKAGLRDDSFWGTGASFVDVDNDGDLDLYACQYLGNNRLYVNEGDGTFSLEDDAFGLDFDGASVMMAFTDYDRDGDLDGYLVTAGLPPGPSRSFKSVSRGRSQSYSTNCASSGICSICLATRQSKLKQDNSTGSIEMTSAATENPIL